MLIRRVVLAGHLLGPAAENGVLVMSVGLGFPLPLECLGQEDASSLLLKKSWLFLEVFVTQKCLGFGSVAGIDLAHLEEEVPAEST